MSMQLASRLPRLALERCPDLERACRLSRWACCPAPIVRPVRAGSGCPCSLAASSCADGCDGPAVADDAAVAQRSVTSGSWLALLCVPLSRVVLSDPGDAVVCPSTGRSSRPVREAADLRCFPGETQHSNGSSARSRASSLLSNNFDHNDG